MQVPVGTLPSGMKLGFLEMESLTSHNQFLLGLGINSDNQDSLLASLFWINLFNFEFVSKLSRHKEKSLIHQLSVNTQLLCQR